MSKWDQRKICKVNNIDGIAVMFNKKRKFPTQFN